MRDILCEEILYIGRLVLNSVFCSGAASAVVKLVFAATTSTDAGAATGTAFVCSGAPAFGKNPRVVQTKRMPTSAIKLFLNRAALRNRPARGPMFFGAKEATDRLLRMERSAGDDNRGGNMAVVLMDERWRIQTGPCKNSIFIKTSAPLAIQQCITEARSHFYSCAFRAT